MKIYNSLNKKTLEFKPLNDKEVTMYACGPTVYKDAHIGNFRTYTLSDLLYRTLVYFKFKVKFVMNLTDVGHLMNDQDSGEDKIEKSAKEQGKTAQEIADFYTKKFLEDYDKLNLTRPNKFTKATHYILDQINLIKELESKGYTYKTSDGIYYDTSKFENYGQLSGLTAENVKEGARIEANKEKRNPTDFALWKFSAGQDRQQEWNSPWGLGFPGWHIECSAMCMAELGETIDIHVGAEDLKMVHHQNEIAQSEACTDKQFVKYWVHGGFLTINEETMNKTTGNVATVTDIIEQGYNPLALRYFYMTAHYRNPLNYTTEALDSAKNSLNKLYDSIQGFKEKVGSQLSEEHIAKFEEALSSDLNMPKALAVMWDLVKSDLSDDIKATTLLKMDKVFGFDLYKIIGFEAPSHIIDMAKTRQQYRKNGIWDKADMIRKEMRKLGFTVIDNNDGSYEIKKFI